MDVCFYVPLTMPRPDRRIGTRAILSGVMKLVVYSYPRGVVFCFIRCPV